MLLLSGIVQGELAPDFTLTDIDENTFSLSNFRGKIVIIEFFATWCGYCIQEIPHLKDVYNEFGEDDLVVISTSKSDNNTQLIDFRNKYQIPWIIARDTANVFQSYNVSGLPTLYLIDHEGAIAHNHQGMVQASTLITKVNELLIVRAAPPEISVMFPENKTYSVDDVPLTFTVNETTSWIGFSLDEQPNVTINGNTTLTSLLDGSHQVVVYASDTSGNMGVSNTVYFTVDTTPPNITNVSQTPTKNNVLPEDEVKVNATVIDDLSGVRQVVLNYTNSNGTWITVDMTNLEENIWNTRIPAFPHATNVTYIIMAEDNEDNVITTEKLGYEYQYKVIPEFLSFLILPLFMIAILIAVIIHKKRKACALRTP